MVLTSAEWAKRPSLSIVALHTGGMSIAAQNHGFIINAFDADWTPRSKSGLTAEGLIRLAFLVGCSGDDL